MAVSFSALVLLITWVESFPTTKSVSPKIVSKRPC